MLVFVAYHIMWYHFFGIAMRTFSSRTYIGILHEYKNRRREISRTIPMRLDLVFRVSEAKPLLFVSQPEAVTTLA